MKAEYDKYNDQLDHYKQLVEAWEQEKFDWEVQNGHAESIEQKYYEALSGNVHPNKEELVMANPFYQGLDGEWLNRHRFIIHPVVEVNRVLKKSKAFHSIGVRLKSDIVLKDKAKAERDSHIDSPTVINFKDYGLHRHSLSIVLDF